MKQNISINFSISFQIHLYSNFFFFLVNQICTQSFCFGCVKTGHTEVPTIRMQNNEEGHSNKCLRDNPFLHALWLLRLRGLRRPSPRKPPHRIRLLQPFLAPRHRQHGHRSPPRRRIPSLLPTPLCIRRKNSSSMVSKQWVHFQGVQNPNSNSRAHPFPRQPLPVGVEDPFRDPHHRYIDAHAIFQWCGGNPWSFRVLAVNRVFPGGNVHCAEENTKVEY